MKISVVIPCYNYEDYVGAAIDSVLTNVRSADEIIVVDDGSTDGSAAIAGNYPQVTLISKPNGGMASALNAGFRHACGDIIVLLDADDTMHENRIQWVEQAFCNDRVVMAWHRLKVFHSRGRDRGTLPNGTLISGDLAEHVARAGLSSFAVTSGIAIRQTLIDNAGEIPEGPFRNSAEAFLIRVAPFLGLIEANQACLGGYRVHDKADSRSVTDLSTESIAKLVMRRTSLADSEHELIESMARQRGISASLDELRSNDKVYLWLYHASCRLGTSTRRAAKRAIDQRARPRGFPRVRQACYLIVPRRMVAWSCAIRLGVGPLPLAPRVAGAAYWRSVGWRSKLQNVVGRTNHS